MDKQLVTSTKRIYYWDNIKGFLIITVVVGHLIELYMNNFSIANNIWAVIYAFHMPAFIFISGYFMRQTSKPTYINCGKMLKYYLIMQLLFASYYFITHEKDSFEISLTSPYYTCWYMLFMVYAYVITSFMKNFNAKYWIPVTFAIGLLAGFDKSIGLQMSVSRIIYFLPFLSLGYYYIDYEKNIAERFRKKWYFFAGIFILIELIIWQITDKSFFNRKVLWGSLPYSSLFKNNILLGLANRGFAYIAGLSLLVCLLALAPKCKTFLSLIGKNTLIIYMVHSLVIKIMFYHVLPDINIFNSKKLNAILTLAIIAIVIAIVSSMGICISNYLKKLKNVKKYSNT